MNLPTEIEEFVNNLVPTDVGVDNVGDFVIHYEGFTEECNDGHDEESIDEVYAEVYQDFDNRQEQKALIRGVAYDELGCGNNPVLYSVYKNINESKLDFKLIDKELSEARLFRTTRSFNIYNGRDIADLLYLTSLTTFMMAKDDKQEGFARSYAKQSTQYGKYNFFRSHATDLYLLAYQVNDPSNRNIQLRNSLESRMFLKGCKFNDRQHWQFFSKVGRGTESSNESAIFFMRLEKQLKISNAKYKQFRRFITDWKNLKYRSKQLVVAQIIQEFRRIGRGSEMINPLSTMTKYKSYRLSDKYRDKPSTTRRVAGAAAGALAGRYVGKKIAQKTGANVDKYKRRGTGIGAIAGYWASGRQRQK